MTTLNGIHHVTAIAGDPQRTLDFFSGTLGMRLVKQTVNFDDPSTYHFYFGDATGAPGTLITFFPWGEGAPAGRCGTDMISEFALSVPHDSLPFWIRHLQRAGYATEGPGHRFGQRVLSVAHADGFVVELVEDPQDGRTGWGSPAVDVRQGIRGVHSVTLRERSGTATGSFLTETLGFVRVGSEANRTRYRIGTGAHGALVDVVDAPVDMPGIMGRGSIHHVAFRVPSDAAQADIRDALLTSGTRVTPVADRRYFRSIYFREPGGALFEIATDVPGFLTDEPVESLGTRLQLPPWMEGNRRIIEQRLPFVVQPDTALT